MSKMRVLSEFWDFMKTNKNFWRAPILIVLLLVGGLLILAKGSVLSPFIYTLF
jgi:hypothetical protein